MEKCLIFNTKKDYVRTKNFIRFTDSIFNHKIVTEKSRILKILEVFRIRKDGWAYIPNFDPLLIFFCRLFGVKAIADILEPFPEMQDSSANRLFQNLFERIAVKNSSLVLTVTEEETDNLKQKYKTNNLLTIRNFPDINDFKPTKTKFKDFSIVYFGVCMPSRNLTNATKAIARLQERYKIDFQVIGDKNLLSQVFCKYKYHGWLNHEKSSKIIGKCHIGIAPYENNIHCNLTLQNKAFQYAACNTIPLSTDLRPLHKYNLIIKTADNSIEGWQKEIGRLYDLWEQNRLKFNQRKIILRNKWIAEDEWKKLEIFLKKRF